MRDLITAGRTYRLADAGRLRADVIVVATLSASTRAAGVSSVRSLRPHTSAHIVANTWLVVAGDPEIACPDLAATAVDVPVQLVVAGVPVDRMFTIPAGSALPFDAVVDATGLPTAVTGTVRRRAFPHTPIGAATVRFDGVHSLGQLVALRTVLASGHLTGAVARPRTLTPGAAHVVTEIAPSGTTTVVLDALGGLAPGDPLDVGAGEVVLVDQIDGPALRVRLQQPLQRTLATGAAVHEVTLGAAGAGTVLTRDAESGDGIIVTAAALAADIVEIVDPPSSEFRALGAVAAVNGVYRLAGVRGIETVDLTFAATGFTSLGPRSHSIDIRRDPTVIDAELTI
jgi:hypothetical protein